MKKLIVSAVIIGMFLLYSFTHARSNSFALATTGSDTPTDTPTSVSTSETPPTGTILPTATTVLGAQFKDGAFTGSVADAQWGYIQVKAIIQGGKLTDVQFLQYPNERNRSIEINQYADPQLKSEAIQAQSAQVDIVTGATDSSLAFMQSLSDALSQAQQ